MVINNSSQPASRPELSSGIIIPCLNHLQISKALLLILRTLKTAGYSVWHANLNAKDFGIPMKRPRWYLVAIQTSRLQVDFDWPQTCKCAIKLGDIITCLPKHMWLPYPAAAQARRRKIARHHLAKLKKKCDPYKVHNHPPSQPDQHPQPIRPPAPQTPPRARPSQPGPDPPWIQVVSGAGGLPRLRCTNPPFHVFVYFR